MLELVINYPQGREERQRFSHIGLVVKWLQNNLGWTSFMIVGTHL